MIDFTEEMLMVAIERIKNPQGKTVASIHNSLAFGCLHCIWKTEKLLISNFYTEAETYFSHIDINDFDYCLFDLSGLNELNDEDVEWIQKCLEYYDLKKISLIGFNSSSPTHNRIFRIFEGLAINIKIFSSQNKATQWLLLPDHDSDLWEDTKVLKY
mgnify:CR=1 FL=1